MQNRASITEKIRVLRELSATNKRDAEKFLAMIDEGFIQNEDRARLEEWVRVHMQKLMISTQTVGVMASILGHCIQYLPPDVLERAPKFTVIDGGLSVPEDQD